MVILITGISGAGKTALCDALWAILKPRLPELVVFDGDAFRAVISGDLAYTRQDRIIQFQRKLHLAKALSEQGCIVLAGALYSTPELLQWNRDNINDYFEVYINAPIELCRKRDTNGLYAKAEAGELTNVVGIDIPWIAPTDPDMVIDAATPATPEELARGVIRKIPSLLTAVADEADG